MKNSVDVFYFAVVVPMHVYFTEDGQMDRKVFLATWKDIPATAEVQSRIPAASLTPGLACFCYQFILLDILDLNS